MSSEYMHCSRPSVYVCVPVQHIVSIISISQSASHLHTIHILFQKNIPICIYREPVVRLRVTKYAPMTIALIVLVHQHTHTSTYTHHTHTIHHTIHRKQFQRVARLCVIDVPIWCRLGSVLFCIYSSSACVMCWAFSAPGRPGGHYCVHAESGVWIRTRI